MGISGRIPSQLGDKYRISSLQMDKLLPDVGGVHLYIIRCITSKNYRGKCTKYTTSLYYYSDVGDSYNKVLSRSRTDFPINRVGSKHPCLFVYKKEIQDRVNRYGCIFTCRIG